MAPEQATGDGEPDMRSDIYALGAVAYYMLTGRPPFPADNPIKVMIAHASEQVTPPSQLRGDLPHDLETMVLKCLAKKPSDRFQDTSELSAAFASCDVRPLVAQGGASLVDAGRNSAAQVVVAAEPALI